MVLERSGVPAAPWVARSSILLHADRRRETSRASGIGSLA